MAEFWPTILGAILGSGLVQLAARYWINKTLNRQDREFERLNQIALARFSGYHERAVDTIAQTYALLVDVHNSVFRYCFPDWDSDDTTTEEREKHASDAMVAFYEHFRRNQVFMEDSTSEQFDRSFRFLQEVFGKRGEFKLKPEDRLRVGTTVYADMTKTLPDMLRNLRAQIKRTIGPAPCPTSAHTTPDG